jgi:hypothetical protein
MVDAVNTHPQDWRVPERRVSAGQQTLADAPHHTYSISLVMRPTRRDIRCVVGSSC